MQMITHPSTDLAQCRVTALIETIVLLLHQTVILLLLSLATCINYADLNNSVLHMRGHVSAEFFHCDVVLLQGKHSGFRHVVTSA